MTKEDIEKDFIVDLPEQVTFENGVMYWESNEQKFWPGLTYRENDIWYGKASITLKMAPKSGIATAFIRGKQSADELDFEWVGKDTARVQSTFFVNGQNTERKEAVYGTAATDLAAEFHTYAINFQQDHIEWSVDGVVTDKRTRAENPTYYPENAREWKMNLWNAGAGHAAWAGPTDWYSEPKSVRAAISAISFESACGADVVKGEHKLLGGAVAAPVVAAPAPVVTAPVPVVPAPAVAATPEPVLPAPPAAQPEVQATVPQA
ncbi:hypothetical protein H4R33_006854 [Dimargaris cristalligena]|nr:hypothetical protein H4R33_006854 [Dimargaris cristalligena]